MVLPCIIIADLEGQTDTDRHQSVSQELLSGWCSPVG
jgi:hypothetical protein